MNCTYNWYRCYCRGLWVGLCSFFFLCGLFYFFSVLKWFLSAHMTHWLPGVLFHCSRLFPIMDIAVNCFLVRFMSFFPTPPVLKQWNFKGNHQLVTHLNAHLQKYSYRNWELKNKKYTVERKSSICSYPKGHMLISSWNQRGFVTPLLNTLQHQLT